MTNLRADASQSGASLQDINALLAFNPPTLLGLPTNRLVIGVPIAGCWRATNLRRSSCQAGSPLPEEPGFRRLSRRHTILIDADHRGFAGAFESAPGTSDVGTRVFIRLAGYPSQARVYAPTLIIGSGSRSRRRRAIMAGRSPPAYISRAR